MPSPLRTGAPQNKGSERAGATKERILRAAGDLFAEKGYLGAGVRDLEQAVGIRRGALYYHIQSKENLLFELIWVFIFEMNQAAWSIVGSTESPEEKLRALARALMRKIADDANVVTVFYREWVWLTGERREQMLAIRDKFEEAVAAILREGTEVSGWVDRGPLIAKGVLGMLNYTHLWFRSSGPVKPEELADMLVDTVILGLKRRSDSA